MVGGTFWSRNNFFTPFQYSSVDYIVLIFDKYRGSSFLFFIFVFVLNLVINLYWKVDSVTV